jgi:MFS family permease
MTTRQRWTLVCTVIGSGAVFLDGTVVNAALKHIGQELPATFVGVLEGQAYIVGGYLAVLAALLILAGALSDHYGRRKVFAIGLVGFAATSALCGLAPTFEWLIVFRLAQGAAGALLIPGSLALITHAFSEAERGRAFGIWAASTSALVVLGPVVGGGLVDTLGWRVAFLINVPLLGFALWATLAHVQESRDTETTGRFDWLGAFVAALAVGGLAFGVIRGQSHAWQDAAAWISIAIGVVALVLFPILMRRRRAPPTRPDPPSPAADRGSPRKRGRRPRAPRPRRRASRSAWGRTRCGSPPPSAGR